ncbi:MAG: DUF1080 domain-containing protein [Rikenellaceae bacterium]
MRTLTRTMLALFAVAQLSGCSSSTTVEHLFNGKDLSNWNLYVDNSTGVDASDVFTVENGVINCSGVPYGYMYTQEKYSNFKLHVEWRWNDEEASNSGIFLFVQEGESIWPNAIETQLCAGKAGDFVLLGGSEMEEFTVEEDEKRPKFPIISKMNDSNEVEVGQWNSADISCYNGNISVTINGLKQNEGTISKDILGYIALQSEGGAIQFRNITLSQTTVQ